MKRFSIISRQAMPEAFAACEQAAVFARAYDDPIYGAFGRVYYAATHPDAADASFAVVENGTPMLLARCNVMQSVLGHFGQAMILVPRADLPEEKRGAVISAALTALEDAAVAAGAKSIRIRDAVAGPELSPLGRGCMARDAVGQVKLHGYCDLSWDEARMRQNLRKSYQSLVNWGRRNLRLVYVNAANRDREKFDSYRRFHRQVAERATRSTESWDVMFDWICRGHGELSLAELSDGSLVAGTVVVDGREVAYYASGVYDRERFDHPMAHFPLFDAVQRSRARGLRRFDLGELPARGSVSDKEFNIGYFKRGFATAIEMHLVWEWAVRGRGQATAAGQ